MTNLHLLFYISAFSVLVSVLLGSSLPNEEPIAIEVMNASRSAMEDVRSYTVTLETFQQTDYLNGNEGFRNNFRQVAKIREAPLQFKQEINAVHEVIDKFGALVCLTNSIKEQTYFDDGKGSFTRSDDTKNWIYHSHSNGEDFLFFSDFRLSQKDQFQLFDYYSASVSVNEYDGSYVLKLTNELIDDSDLLYYLKTFGEEHLIFAEFFGGSKKIEDLDIQYFEYSLFIDKADMTVSKANVVAELYSGEVGKQALTKQVVNMDWTDMNQHLPLKIPEEILTQTGYVFNN